MGRQARRIASVIDNDANGYKGRRDDDIMKHETTSKRENYDKGLRVDDTCDTDVSVDSSKRRESEKNGTDHMKEEFTRAVESLFDHEEELLNLHMNVIQENAELLTEEGRLLQSIQGNDIMDYDIDAYCYRLAEITKRKQDLNDALRDKLVIFKDALMKEEELSASMKEK